MNWKTSKSGHEAWKALGRKKQGVMNETEKAYAHRLQSLLFAGEILWYGFETMKFRLADNMFYEPDFTVLTKDMLLEVHEVKGSFIAQKGLDKFNMANAIHPVQFVLAQLIKKEWKITRL